MENLVAYAKNNPSQKYNISFDGGSLEFLEEEFEENAEVTFRFTTNIGAEKDIVLPHNPMEQSIVLNLDKTNCTEADFTIAGDTIHNTCDQN